MSQRQFRIGDLANELKVKKFVIRFWEQEFQLSSERSEGGHRFYNDDDLKTFQLIKTLLYQQGYTIEGARKQLPILLKEQSSNFTASDAQLSAETIEVMPLAESQETCGGAYVSHDALQVEPSHIVDMHSAISASVPCTTCEKHRQHIDHIKHELLSLKHRLERL